MPDNHTADAFAYATAHDRLSEEQVRVHLENQEAFIAAIKRRQQEYIDNLLRSVFGDEELRAFVRPNPERRKALERLRDLKRLRDGTTYEGERNNAQAAMDRIMAKHAIGAHEI